MKRELPNRTHIYHGWYVIAVCVVVAVATTRSAFGVFVIPMSEDFGWSRGTISIAASVGFLAHGLAQPLMGKALDQLGARRVIMVSLVVAGLSIAALGLTSHIVFLIIIFGVIGGTAFAGTSPANIGTLLAKWFRRNRAMAIGLSGGGVALGGLLIVPLATYLVQATNWRLTWLILGLIVLLVAVPLVYLFVHDGPEKLGLRPDGDAHPDARSLEETDGPSPDLLAGPLESQRWVEPFRSWPIWQITAGFFVDGFTTSILSVHFVAYAIDRGVPPTMAAVLFGFMMVFNIVGSAATGMMSDRMERKTVLTAIYLLRGCGFLVVLLLPGASGLWAFAAIIGFSQMSTTPQTVSLTADIYGLRALGVITGITVLVRQTGAASGILIAGFLFDATGAYTWPFVIAGLLLIPAALASMTIEEQRYSSRYQGRFTC